MKRKAPTIDISASVMQRIEQDNIRMRSSLLVQLSYVTKWIGLIIATTLSLVGILSLAYVFRHDVFTAYTSLISKGAFVRSLPWPGIVITVLSLSSFTVILRKLRADASNLRIGYFAVAMLVLVGCMAILSVVVSPESTPGIIARTAYGSNKDPVELRGKVIEIIDKDTLKVEVNGKQFIVFTNTEGINIGDTILILGSKSKNNVYAKVIKITSQAPAEVNAESDKKEETKIVEPEQQKPTEQPKSVTPEKPKTTTQVPPKPEPTPTPEPTPEPSPGIYIVSKYQDTSNVTINYSIYPSMAGKCKTMLKKDATIVYSDYDWHSAATNSCINTIPKSSLSSGVWTGIAYWKFPYYVWSDYYQVDFTIEVTIP